MAEPQIEIRIITFRRPKLLRRAIECLRRQTLTNWRAIVFDDSDGAEGRAVVNDIGDSRVEYRLNPTNLGMVRNTSQAFAVEPYFGGSKFACVLEDDNTYAPELLQANADALSSSGLNVLARNYEVSDVLEDETIIQTPHQPMRDLWGNKSRAITLQERVGEAFFSFSLGNLSYFWDLTKGVDLSVSQERLHGPVSEASRSVNFSTDCWYEPDPLSTFSRFVCKDQTPRQKTPVSTRSRRLAMVSEIRFTRRLIHLWTRELSQPLSRILSTATQRQDGTEAMQRLAEAGCLSAFVRLKKPGRWMKALKTAGVYVAYSRL